MFSDSVGKALMYKSDRFFLTEGNYRHIRWVALSKA
jgi:hypothetical protein